MIFTLEPLQALEGDCLLLHFGTKDSPALALIDGGPARVYEDTLRPRLEAIRQRRKQPRLDLELVMVSHVDTDHIVGVRKLFAQLQKELAQNLPGGPLRVRRLWHNTFNDIVGDATNAYYDRFTASFTASTGGEPVPAVVDAIGFDTASILAGHADARTLRDSHDFLFQANQIAALNRPFTEDGASTLITAGLQRKARKVKNLSFRVIAPLQADLEALQADFDKFLKKEDLTASALLAAYADTSIPNLSSIVCLVQGNGKSLLLTGDARGDHILQALEKTRVLKKGARLQVDVLKVPHHGSIRNVEGDFFARIHATTYVFSGNGKHGNPDRETLELLADTRGPKARYQMVLTYDVKSTDAGRRAQAKKDGKPWSPKRDSLATFFVERKKQGFKFTVSAGEGKLIQLGTTKVTW